MDGSLKFAIEGGFMHTDPKMPLMVAGIIFSLFALLHVLRLVMGWGLIIGTFSVPLWWSGVGLIIAALLAFWMFKSSCCKECDVCDK